MSKIANWWGSFELDEGQSRYWEIGPLILQIERHAQEWRVGTGNRDINSTNITIASEEPPKKGSDTLQFKRFVFRQTEPTISLIPMVADRPQVSRAEVPFYLPPHENVTIYVSSPVWMRIEVSDEHSVLTETPSVRLSDTWYGPNTREGELCYASPTFCRTNLKDLSLRSHRVISPLIIYNQSKTPMLLDQFSIPLPFLSVYSDIHGRLWTEEIIVKNENNNRHTVRQGKGAPNLARDAKLVSQPRFHLKAHNIINLFYSLLTE